MSSLRKRLGGIAARFQRETEVPPADPRVELTVADVQRGDSVVLITLHTPDGKRLHGYEPGCHADFYLRADSGEELVRPYSLFPMDHLGVEGKDGAYGISVKLEENSRGGSIALHKLEVGDTVRIGKPRNNFPLAKDAKRSILVGAGVGIAPIYSLARDLQRNDADYSVLYFASSEERAVMQRTIEEYLQGKTKSIFATGERDQQAGYIEEAFRASDVPAEDTHLYVCGPQGFMDGVVEVASQTLPASHVHWEVFRATEETLAGDKRADGEFEVHFGGETYTIPEGESVLDVFEDEDVPIMSQCFEGTCGTCIMRVIDGTPDHRDSIFTEEQHERGAFATCVSRSLSPSLTLERWKNSVR